MATGDIVIYIPGGAASPEEKAMVEALEMMRDDPILFACVAEDARDVAYGRKTSPWNYDDTYKADVQRLAALTEEAMEV